MARRLVGAGGTGVLATDAMSMRPAVVPRVRSLRRSPASSQSHRWSPRATRHRFRQFLVGCGERANGGRESQIGRRELLENSSVVCCRERKVVECRLQPIAGAAAGSTL